MILHLCLHLTLIMCLGMTYKGEKKAKKPTMKYFKNSPNIAFSYIKVTKIIKQKYM